MATFSQQFIVTVATPIEVFNANAAPTSFITNQGGPSSTILQWNAPAGTVAGTSVDYIINWKRAIDYSWIVLPVFSSTAAVPSFVVTGLPANSFFHFRVRANGSRYCAPYPGNTTKNGATEDYDGNHIAIAKETLVSAFLTGIDGTQYSLLESADKPFRIAQNGVDDGISSEVIRLVYSGHKIWQENKDYNWWSKSLIGDVWVQDFNPCNNAPPVGNTPAGVSIRDLPTGTVMGQRGGHISSGSPITFVYWGDYWNTTPPFPAPSDITAAMTTSYGGPYFSGMQEYGVFAKPHLVNTSIVPGTVIDYTNSTDSKSDLFAFLTGLFDAGTIPVPLVENALIMVLMPPAAGTPAFSGFHTAMLYKGIPITVGQLFFFGSGAQNSLDQFTIGLTHETAENCTDPVDNPFLAFLGPGDGSVPGAILYAESNDFNNQVQTSVNGIAQMGFYSNRLRAVIVPTVDTPFPT